uniref:Peptidase S1 domain-containing protein n=1 Tax=Graphocephala atropunctata TaxID=36148 RepID=A0A1B6L3J7_9HEMI
MCVDPVSCVNKFNLSTPLRFPYGDNFCRRDGVYNEADNTLCCHMSTLFQNKEPGETWAYKDMPYTQKFAAGFKASFMCEQYNRYVCDGREDRCPLRVLDRDTALPGEFPHQVLVGVASTRIQFFHCAGSLVSKNFVLTALDCNTYDGLKATIALLGEYLLYSYNEGFTQERISYIDVHFTNKRLHFLLLLRLWRPVVFNSIFRPACLDWAVIGEKPVTLPANSIDFGVGWLTGYSPLSEYGYYNDTVKRYSFRYADTKGLQECLSSLPYNRGEHGFNLLKSKTHICVANGRLYSPNYDQSPDSKLGQGYFDMGAPFNVYKSYCQWNVFGVSIQDPTRSTKAPIPIETVLGLAEFESLESTIWDYDFFDMIEFNMTMPDCAHSNSYNFKNMKFLKREYSKFYN